MNEPFKTSLAVSLLCYRLLFNTGSKATLTLSKQISVCRVYVCLLKIPVSVQVCGAESVKVTGECSEATNRVVLAQNLS